MICFILLLAEILKCFPQFGHTLKLLCTSSLYKISRQKAAEFIRAGHVKVNHKPVEQINYLCNNKDIISFKKHGRVMFVDCNKQTRSGNYVVEGYFYK